MTHDVVTFRLQDGGLPPESWVYAVVSATGRVLHVGSTALPLRTRVWLHLSHDDPEVGRLRAEVAPTELADAGQRSTDAALRCAGALIGLLRAGTDG